MADEERATRIPPEQMRELGQHVFELLGDDIRMLLKNSARAPAPVPPSTEMDRFKSELLRDLKDLITERTKNFVPGSGIDDLIDRKLLLFEKRVQEIFHEEIVDTLRRIGVRVDDEHIDETAEDFRSMLKTHKNVNRLVMGLGFTFATGLFLGLLKLLGLNLPTGGEH